MKLQTIGQALGLLLTALSSGCGSPAPPSPPSLELAQPVRDLRALRKGDRVFLTWSVPVETTDRHNIRHPGVTKVCRSLEPSANSCDPPLATIPARAVPAANSGTAKPEAAYTDQLSTNFEREHASDSLLYSVSVVNSYGKTAGPSNQVSIPAAPTLRPPHNFKAEIEADGVKLSWEPVLAPSISNLRFVYRVYRRESEAGPETIVGDLPLDRPGPPAMVDRSFDWEKTYQYGVRVVTIIATGARVDEQVDGEDSEPKRLSTNDVFPPATPTGLQAVFSASANKASIDLVWTPNSEADLAGYNVYRREPDKPFVKLNQEVVRASAYRDPDITLGKQYFYSVSALDVRDNESPRSEEASESTPAP